MNEDGDSHSSEITTEKDVESITDETEEFMGRGEGSESPEHGTYPVRAAMGMSFYLIRSFLIRRFQSRTSKALSLCQSVSSSASDGLSVGIILEFFSFFFIF